MMDENLNFEVKVLMSEISKKLNIPLLIIKRKKAKKRKKNE
jgi:hypothetical protein